MIDFRHQ